MKAIIQTRNGKLLMKGQNIIRVPLMKEWIIINRESHVVELVTTDLDNGVILITVSNQ